MDGWKYAALALAMSGCGAGASPGAVAVDVTGAEGAPIAATNHLDVLVVEVGVGGAHGGVVVDTGSPIVALDPAAFAGTTVPAGGGTVPALTLGALTFTRPYVVGADLVPSPDPTAPLAGSLGCGVLCAFAVALDYRASTVTLGAAAPPAGVESPGGAVAFSRRGGGSVTIDGVPGSVEFPPSRVTLAATVEGHAYTLVLDSGSSFVVLRQAAFASFLTDGRGQIDGVATASQGATSTSSIARLRSVTVGGETVTGIVGSSDPALDAALDGIAAEVGATVDGLVGGSFLRQFHVTVDYPAGVLHLRRYTEGGPTFDAFDRVGVSLAPGSGTSPATVAYVFAGTDAAAKGVTVGDEVLGLDAVSLTGVGATALETAVAGAAGSTKSVSFGHTSSASLGSSTITIGVDDVLPLP